MPGLADPGPSGIAAPNPAALVQPMNPVSSSDAVSEMIAAFRNGQISAQDIVERAGASSAAKRQAELVQAQSLASPEAAEARRQTLLATAAKAKTEADNAELAGVTQANKMKHENAVAMLGVNGPKIDAAYTSVGRLIPMKEDPQFPGVSIPDIDKIREELPKITEYASVRARQAAVDAAWQPKKVVVKDANGRTVTVQGWRNEVSGEERATKPPPAFTSYDNWLKGQNPGEIVVTPKAVADTSLVTPIQIGEPTVAAGGRRDLPAPSQAEATKMQQQIERVTGQDLGTSLAAAPAAGLVQPAAGTSYKDWPVIDVQEPDWDARTAQVKTAFQSHPLIMGLNNAKAAYDAATDVTSAIQPDGNYSAQLSATPKQADYKLMVNFAKILDPNSVVREGEITLLAGTKSQWGRVADIKTGKDFADYVSAMTGQKIFTSHERLGMKNLLDGAYQGRVASANDLKGQYENQLRQMGVPEDRITSSFILPSASKPAGPRASGAVETKAIAGGAVMEKGADGVWRLSNQASPK